MKRWRNYGDGAIARRPVKSIAKITLLFMKFPFPYLLNPPGSKVPYLLLIVWVGSLSACSTLAPPLRQTHVAPAPVPEEIVRPAPDTEMHRLPESEGPPQEPQALVADLPYPNVYQPPKFPIPEESAPQIQASLAPSAPRSAFSELPGSKIIETPKLFTDDMSRHSLRLVIAKQLAAMANIDAARRVRLGNRTVTQYALQRTLRAFDRLLQLDLSPTEFTRRIHQQFHIIPVGRGQHKKRMLFTGYYTPILEARRTRSQEYSYPLYRKPAGYPAHRDAVSHARANNRDSGFHLVSTRQEVLLTRAQIDGEQILKNQNLEVAWLKDDLERYFLHIQGSGYLSFPDGTSEAILFGGSNQMPYRSVGRQMIEDGVITLAQGSMQGIKQYFRDHPEDIKKYLFQNHRYIFFDLVEGGAPRGSSGSELVGGRSIATDKSIYPAGGLAFIVSQKPVLDATNEFIGWQKFSRFVVDQDTGSAIRGSGRVDLYFGIGDAAGAAAGHHYRQGKAFYLLLK